MRRTLILVLALATLALALVPSLPPVEGGGSDPVISGHVQDLTGVPMMSVGITVVSVSNDSVYTCSTGPDGDFSLGLPVGTYNISATIAGLAANATYRQVPVSANLTGFNFTIDVITGTVSGSVSYGSVPLIASQVFLSNENGTYVGNTSLPYGQYSIPGVVPGVYVGRAEQIGYWTNISQAPVFVEAGLETTLAFVLEPQPARISGKVTIGGNAAEGVKVSLISGSSTVKFAVTDVHGNYTLSNVIAGEYQVVFTKEGLVEKSYPVSISPFEERDLSISMSVAPIQGGKGFIADLDLTHSLMVVGLIVATLVALFALIIRARAMKKPDLLAKEEEEEADSDAKMKKRE